VACRYLVRALTGVTKTAGQLLKQHIAKVFAICSLEKYPIVVATVNLQLKLSGSFIPA
jgi:hypothetical protein